MSTTNRFAKLNPAVKKRWQFVATGFWRAPLSRRNAMGGFAVHLIVLIVCLVNLGPAATSEEVPNVLLICVDDLRPELNCYGVPYIHSPHIDRLASRGRAFHRHFVQAPTCGASRYTLLTGRYGGGGNHALFQRAAEMQQAGNEVTPSMPAWFRQHGYATVSVGKVSHHPGGWGGDRWNDQSQPEMPDSWDRSLLPAGKWKDPRGWMHGLAHGEIRIDAKKPQVGVEMDVFQAAEGPDSIYPDGGSIDEAIRQMKQLTNNDPKPFFLAVGILRPHLPWGAPATYLKQYRDTELPPIPHPNKPSGRTTWHRSGEFMKYDRWGCDPNEDREFATLARKHYAACITYADQQVGRLLDELDRVGASDRTIVVLWGDHGWHLGEHAIWGKHSLFEESLHSPLIISHPNMDRPGQKTNAMVETLDIFPTLCELAGLPVPTFAQGVSLVPVLENPDEDGHVAVAYHRNAKTIRTETHRLIQHQDGFVELYDHRSPDAETENVAADNDPIVQDLIHQLRDRLGD